MKSSIKKMSALLTMMAVAILTFTFTACSDDDDPVTEVTYTYGFSSMSASHPDFLEEMGKIENAFQSALLTSSLRHPKIFVKEFSDFLMSCHQHCLGVNLLVQR